METNIGNALFFVILPWSHCVADSVADNARNLTGFVAAAAGGGGFGDDAVDDTLVDDWICSSHNQSWKTESRSTLHEPETKIDQDENFTFFFICRRHETLQMWLCGPKT